MMTSMANGKKKLKELIDNPPKNSTDMNEAETRFHIIDKIINSCLGWPKEIIHVEIAQKTKIYGLRVGRTPYRYLDQDPQGVALLLQTSVIHRKISREHRKINLQFQSFFDSNYIRAAVARVPDCPTRWEYNTVGQTAPFF